MLDDEAVRKQTELRDKMRGGQGPDTPEEWAILAELLTGMASFNGVVNQELDMIEIALTAIEKAIVAMARKVAPEEMKKIEEELKNYAASEGFHVPEVQEEDDFRSDS